MRALLVIALSATLAVVACDDTRLAAPETAQDEGPALIGAGGKADGLLDVPAYAPLADDADLTLPFEVLFAPDEPVATVELALVDDVIAARRADARTFVEGENPYRIRYAVYNLRNEPLVARLIAAERAGVDVQILIEDDQLDVEKDYNTADETLVAAGFELAPSHRALDAAGRRTADLVAIVGSGLMHLKTRIFERPGSAVVLSGSLNPGDNAMLNEENLQLIRDPALVARYQEAYQAVLEGRRIPNTFDDAAAVNVLFSPAASGPRAGTKLLDWIGAENEQILLMVYSLRDIAAAGHDEKLVDLLVAKAKAGVPVWLITDRKQSDGVDADGKPLYVNDRTEDRLRQGGVHVYEVISTAGPFNAMHHKVGILGRTHLRVITDAANWTTAALGNATTVAKNHESQLYIDSDRLDGGRTGRRYLAQFARVLRRYAYQSVRDGEPDADKALAQLTAQPGWPTEAVHFEVNARTAWGEYVAIRGDAPALGSWGAPGFALTTDDLHYPLWFAATPPELPVGAAFAWKITATRGGESVRWEPGADRQGFAQPTPLAPNAGALHTGTWGE